MVYAHQFLSLFKDTFQSRAFFFSRRLLVRHVSPNDDELAISYTTKKEVMLQANYPFQGREEP